MDGRRISILFVQKIPNFERERFEEEKEDFFLDNNIGLF